MGRHSEPLQNLGDGLKGSIHVGRKSGQFANCLAASDLICLVKCCLATEWLVLISSLHPGGNWVSGTCLLWQLSLLLCLLFHFLRFLCVWGYTHISSASWPCLVVISSIFLVVGQLGADPGSLLCFPSTRIATWCLHQSWHLWRSSLAISSAARVSPMTSTL